MFAPAKTAKAVFLEFILRMFWDCGIGLKNFFQKIFQKVLWVKKKGFIFAPALGGKSQGKEKRSS